MNLDFSDDQKFLQDEAKKFFDKEGGLNNARTVMDNALEGDQELWQKIVDLGWTGIRVPEKYEGLGLGHLELCVIAEELGRSLAPVPFSSSVYFFTEALIKFGSEDIKSNLLPKLVSGDVVGTYGIAEDKHQATESNLVVTVESEKINGVKIAVPDAGVASQMIVVVKSNTGTDLRKYLQNASQKEELLNLILTQLRFKKESHYLELGNTGITPHLASIGG